MNGTSYEMIFKALGSEVMVVFTALVALSVDLVLGRGADVRRRSHLAATVVSLGVLAALVPLLGQYGWNPGLSLGGTIVVDDLGIIFKGLILALTAVAVMMSMYSDIGHHVGEYYAVLLFAAVGMMLL